MKKLVTAAIAFVAMTVQTLAAPASLDDISDYLETLQSVTADFVQFNPDGSQSNGTMFLKRPGKLRFEYNGNNSPLVMIGGGQVAVFDPLSNEPPFRFPVSQTPFAPVIGRTVDLDNTRFETFLLESGEFTILNVQDPRYAEYGYVSLVFDTEPLQLRQWVVIDGAGQQTAIALTQINTGAQIKNSIFNIRAEMRARGFEIN